LHRAFLAVTGLNQGQSIGCFLADEPTASLDKKSGQEAVEILQRLAREQGCTILLVTHDYRILDMADRVVTLEDGIIAPVNATANS
jgi:putative ABC transport system ATP-binding protein